MEMNDGSAYRIVTDTAAQLAEREVFCFRTASARNGAMYVDAAHTRHREQLAGMQALVMYQYVWAQWSPEEQADFFVSAIGQLRPNEMVMLDLEVGSNVPDPADFTRRWLSVVEGDLGTRAWLYIPRTLNAAVRPEVGGRIVMAPKYSGTALRGTPPDWPHDVHQYSSKGYFPGCTDPQGGDVSYTELTPAEMLTRCDPKEPSMATSYNGWTAERGWSVSGGQLQPLVVAGEAFSPGVRAGDVHTVLEYVANELHKRVEPVVRPDWHQADDWGYSYRANTNNPTQLSCHASGTAIDYNATRHPNGKGGTWTAAQKAEIQAILRDINNVVRCLWGYDEMHFEITGNAAQVSAAATKIRAGGGGGGGSGDGTNDPNDDVLEVGDSGPAVVALQEVLNRWYPTLPQLVADGDFGPATRDRVIHFQKAASLTADGQVGAASRKVLGLKAPADYNTPPPPPPPPTLVPGGGIEAAYNALPQSMKDVLGPLLIGERALGDGRGAGASFATGAYYFTPEHGSFLVQGAIFGAYASVDYERSSLGYPVSNEFRYSVLDNDLVVRAKTQTNFERGSIVFDDTTAQTRIYRP